MGGEVDGPCAVPMCVLMSGLDLPTLPACGPACARAGLGKGWSPELQRPAAQGRHSAEVIGHATGTKECGCLVIMGPGPGDTGSELG